MAWNEIAEFSVGEVLTAAAMNEIAADINLLEGSVQMLGNGGLMAGSVPTGAQYLEMSGLFEGEVSEGNYVTVTMPETFPNALISVQVTPWLAGGDIASDAWNACVGGTEIGRASCRERV